MYHVPDAKLELLALGMLPTRDSLRAQRHCMNCSACLRRLVEIAAKVHLLGLAPDPIADPDSRKPLHFVHDTADGMIYSSVERQGRKWFGYHWGNQLDGGKLCRTMREANEYVVESFRQMFPEHLCTVRCGPTKAAPRV